MNNNKNKYPSFLPLCLNCTNEDMIILESKIGMRDIVIGKR